MLPWFWKWRGGWDRRFFCQNIQKVYIGTQKRYFEKGSFGDMGYDMNPTISIHFPQFSMDRGFCKPVCICCSASHIPKPYLVGIVPGKFTNTIGLYSIWRLKYWIMHIGILLRLHILGHQMFIYWPFNWGPKSYQDAYYSNFVLVWSKMTQSEIWSWSWIGFCAR